MNAHERLEVALDSAFYASRFVAKTPYLEFERFYDFPEAVPFTDREVADLENLADWCDYERDMVDMDDREYDGFMSDAEADADVLRNAGMGTDEDYGYYDDYEYNSYSE